MRRAAVFLALSGFLSAAHSTDLPSSNKSDEGSLCGGTIEAHCQATPGNRDRQGLLETWGFVSLPVYATGSRVAPNGIAFDPLFAIGGNFNIGLLPKKKLYLFIDANVWMQRAAPGVTNAAQGHFDFSKREFDFSPGIAWNYYGSFEARVSGYDYNNLNRGNSTTTPSGFNDGVLFENRFYFGNVDKYDVGRLSFLSVGYYPTKTMVGGNGETFSPGLFGHAYVTYGLPFLGAYLYGDFKYTGERAIKPRLLELDAGIALRPFEEARGVEMRFGSNVVADVHDKVSHNLIYGAVRLNY